MRSMWERRKEVDAGQVAEEDETFVGFNVHGRCTWPQSPGPRSRGSATVITLQFTVTRVQYRDFSVHLCSLAHRLFFCPFCVATPTTGGRLCFPLDSEVDEVFFTKVRFLLRH